MEGRYVDWWEAFKGDEWEFIGRQVMEERKGDWSDTNPEGLEGDDYFPMYNFAYPLEVAPDQEVIFRICNETACTVVYHIKEDAYYLALCGCGMDFSQSIALAYMIAYSYDEEKYGRIPDHLLFDVIKEGPMSVGKKQYDNLGNIEKLTFVVTFWRHRFCFIIRKNTIQKMGIDGLLHDKIIFASHG